MAERAAQNRSAITLAVLAAVLIAGIAWAWSQVTETLPSQLRPGPCTSQSVAAGDPVRPGQVLVSVLNASERRGLAGQTMDALTGHGFGQGELANARASAAIAPAAVWASPDDPAARLVASHLGKDVEIVDQPSSYPGITVVVGETFGGVTQGRKQVTAESDTTVCAPN